MIPGTLDLTGLAQEMDLSMHRALQCHLALNIPLIPIHRIRDGMLQEPRSCPNPRPDSLSRELCQNKTFYMLTIPGNHIWTNREAEVQHRMHIKCLKPELLHFQTSMRRMQHHIFLETLVCRIFHTLIRHGNKANSCKEMHQASRILRLCPHRIGMRTCLILRPDLPLMRIIPSFQDCRHRRLVPLCLMVMTIFMAHFLQ